MLDYIFICQMNLFNLALNTIAVYDPGGAKTDEENVV